MFNSTAKFLRLGFRRIGSTFQNAANLRDVEVHPGASVYQTMRRISRKSPSSDSQSEDKIVYRHLRNGGDYLLVNRQSTSRYTHMAGYDLPPEISKNHIKLKCDSSAEGGKCDVYVVGTVHLFEKSIDEVRAVISHLKPEVVFLEICHCRIQYIEVGAPPNEFQAAVDEVSKYGGQYVFGDIPYDVTKAKMKDKDARKCILLRVLEDRQQSMVISTLNNHIFSADEDSTEPMDYIEMYYYNLPPRTFAELLPFINVESTAEVILHHRDKYMSARLLKLAKKQRVVVAVVGKAHLAGMTKNWEKTIEENQFLMKPSSSLHPIKEHFREIKELSIYHIKELSYVLAYFVLLVLCLTYVFGVSLVLPLIVIILLV